MVKNIASLLIETTDADDNLLTSGHYDMSTK